MIDAVLVRLPEVPVMVTVDVPGVAELAALSVSVLGLVVLARLNDAVTPLGRPDVARATVPVKPFCGVMVIVLLALAPCATLTLAGDAVIVNAGSPVTVSNSRVLLVRLPEVPEIVIDDVDEAAEALTVSVSVLVVVAVAGLNDAVTPVGRPDAARLTALVKPFCALMVMVLVPLAPAVIASVDADEDRPKDGPFDTPVRLLIRGWPAGLPHPVARS